MTTIPQQLRQLADRLEAAEAERVACMDMLAAFMQGWQTDGRSVEPWDDDPDSAAVLVAAEDQPGAPEDVSAPNGSGASPGLPPPAPIDAGGGVGYEDPTSPSAIEQATSEERGEKAVLPGGPATIPASPGTEPGQDPSEQPPAATGGTPVPAFDPLGPMRSARSLLPERDRLVLAPARPRPGEKRTCPKCEKTWPPQGFLTHVRWCPGTKGA